MNLRHDLLTSGWAMLDCSKWLDSFNQHWQETPNLSFKYLHLFHQVYRDFIGEMDWLLHEALPDEQFRFINAIAANDVRGEDWHLDWTYLRVLFACRGVGTLVSRSFENNLVVPHGYALVMSGTDRHYHQKIPATWHSSPNDGWERRLFVADFY